MIALPSIAIQDKIYESLHSLVYQGIRAQDGRAHCFADTARVVVKRLKQEHPSPQELTRYRQEYAIPQPGRSSQDRQLVLIGSRHLVSQGAPSAINEESD